MDKMKRLQQFFKQDKDDAAFRQAGQEGEFGEYDDDTDQWSKPLGSGFEEPFPGEGQARYLAEGEQPAEGVQVHTTAQEARWVTHADEERAYGERDFSDSSTESPEEDEDPPGVMKPYGQLTGAEREKVKNKFWELVEQEAKKKDFDESDPEQYRELSDKEMQELGDYAQYREDESKEPERDSLEGQHGKEFAANVEIARKRGGADTSNKIDFITENMKGVSPDEFWEYLDKPLEDLKYLYDPKYATDEAWEETKEPERGTPEDPDRDEYWEEYSGYEPTNKSADIQKLSSGAMSALAGWWLGGSIQDAYRQVSEPTPAQQREFERQIQQAMRKKNKNLSKSQALQKLQLFFSTQTDNNDTYVRRKPLENAVTQPDAEAELLKVLGAPPFAGARFDPSSHRWVKPENFGNTYMARGGKKRIRGSGTGIHERSISGHGKGRIRGEGAGRKGKLETDLAASRRKQGFTHTDLKHPKKK